MTYQTAAEAAADVRAAYKAEGWNSRMISVRADNYSMGSALRIEIKDARIPLWKARNLAEGKEEILRCEYSGEILSGGNRYVTVTVSDDARKAKAAPYLDAVAKADAELQTSTGSGTLIEIIPGYCLGRGMHGMYWSLWSERHLSECTSLAEISYVLAIAKENRDAGRDDERIR